MSTVSHGAERYVDLMARLLASPPEGASFREDVEAAIFQLTNAYRRSKKRKPLTKNTAMRDAARAHAADLMAMKTMGHVASSGHDFSSRIRALRPGQMFLPAMAENAARQRTRGLSVAEKAEDVVAQWIKSGSHRKAMLSRDYESVAIGAVMRGDELYAVQIFVGPEVKTNLGGSP